MRSLAGGQGRRENLLSIFPCRLNASGSMWKELPLATVVQSFSKIFQGGGRDREDNESLFLSVL